MQADGVAEVREFETGGNDGAAFRALNEEWIVRHFSLEPRDLETLSDPEGTILAKGGRILVAEREGEVVGCVALIPMGDGVVELSKMAVAPAARGRGLGRRLLLRAVEVARAMRMRRIFLGSSMKLADAVHLYEAVGFRHVPMEELPPLPYTRASVWMEMDLKES